jgi:hypothetical protein
MVDRYSRRQGRWMDGLDTHAYKSYMGTEGQLDELDGDSLDLSVLNSESKQLQDSDNTASCRQQEKQALTANYKYTQCSVPHRSQHARRSPAVSAIKPSQQERRYHNCKISIFSPSRSPCAKTALLESCVVNPNAGKSCACKAIAQENVTTAVLLCAIYSGKPVSEINRLEEHTCFGEYCTRK